MPVPGGKYARVERERRFLLAGPPPESAVTAARRITDRYLAGTRLRLRRVERPDEGTCEFKLTQKIAAEEPGIVQGLITNIHLSRGEYERLASLPAMVLSKTPRHVTHYVSNDEARQEFSIVLTGRPLSGQPTPSNESSEVRWVPTANIGAYDMNRAMRKRIERFLSPNGTPEII